MRCRPRRGRGAETAGLDWRLYRLRGGKDGRDGLDRRRRVRGDAFRLELLGGEFFGKLVPVELLFIKSLNFVACALRTMGYSLVKISSLELMMRVQSTQAGDVRAEPPQGTDKLVKTHLDKHRLVAH